jgi:hypothetical protein
MVRSICAIAGLASLILGCGAATPAPPRIGVFADTGSLTELTVYVSEGPAKTFSARQVAGIPAAAVVRCFYVTMPDVDILRSKAFLLPESGGVSEDTPSLRTEIDELGDGAFKVTVPELKGKKGLVGLKLAMRPGTPGRLYLVRLD